MRLATTLILLFALLGSVSYIVFYERAKPTTAEIRSTSGQVSQFDPAKIRAISVRGPAEVVALHRDESGAWQIDEPFADRADPAWADALLAAAGDLQTVETIAESEIGESVDLKDTGLGDDRFEVEFKPDGGEPIRLLVGKPSPLKGTTYLQNPEGGKDIHIVTGELHPLLARPPSELRDQRLFRIDPTQLTGISLKSKGGEIEIERGGEDEFWMLTRPLQTRGHREFIDDLLALLTNTEITGLASNGNGTDVRTFDPGQTTTVTLNHTGGDSKPVTLEIIKPIESEPEKILARVSDRTPIFKVDPELLLLLNRSPNDLRDDFLANIDPEAVSAISITDIKGYRTMIRRRGNLWALERNGTFEAANYKAISDFFKTLNEEKIIDFAADSSANLEPYGLDRPYLRILLAGFETDGEESGEDDAGPSGSEREIVDLRIGANRDDGKLYANFVGEPFIYRIGDILLGAAPANPLKWKALNILRFSYTNLKEITVARGSEPPTTVTSNFNVQRFRAEYGGKDATEMLDKGRLTGLALTLSGLRAARWVTDDIEEVPELKNPSLILNLTIDHPLPEGGRKTFPVELSFAPTTPGRRTPYFYGKLKSAPEVFVIPYSTYRALAASLIVDPDRPKPPGTFDDGLPETPVAEPTPPISSPDPITPDSRPKPTKPDSSGEDSPGAGIPSAEGEKPPPPLQSPRKRRRHHLKLRRLPHPGLPHPDLQKAKTCPGEANRPHPHRPPPAIPLHPNFPTLHFSNLAHTFATLSPDHCEESSIQHHRTPMSQHNSLKKSGSIGAKRSVLKRFERVKLLKKRGQWKEGMNPIGLPKTEPEA